MEALQLPFVVASQLIDAGYSPAQLALGLYEVTKGAYYVGRLAYSGGRWVWDHLPEQHWENLPFYPARPRYSKTPEKRRFRGSVIDENNNFIRAAASETRAYVASRPVVEAKRFKTDVQRAIPPIPPLYSTRIRGGGMVRYIKRSAIRRAVRRYGTRRTPSRARAVVRSVITRMAERKYLFGSLGWAANSIDASNGQHFCFNVCQQGTDQSHRIGNRISITKLHLSGTLVGNVTNGANSFFRLIFYLDKECRGAACALSDLLQVPGAIISPFAPVRLDNIPRRFRILSDRVYWMNQQYSTASMVRPFKRTFVFRRPIVTQFMSNAGTISDIVTPSLCVYAMFNSDVDKGSASLAYQLQFTDV